MPGIKVRAGGAWVDLTGERAAALGAWLSPRRVNVAKGGGFSVVGVNVDVMSKVKLILDACKGRIIYPTAPQKLNATPPGYPTGGYLGGTYINWRGDWNGDPATANLNTNYNIDGTTDAGRTPTNVVANGNGGSGHSYSYQVVAQYFDIAEGIPTDPTNTVVSGGSPVITFTPPAGAPTHYRVLRSVDGGTYLQPAAYSGTSTSWRTSGAPNYTPAVAMVDMSRSWTPNQWAGYGLLILNNTTFRGRCATILSNDATSLTFTSHFSANPAAATAYAIVPLSSGSSYTDSQAFTGVAGVQPQAARHDPTTDITYLRNLLDYAAATGSHAYDDDIATLTPIVYQNFWKYGSYKAWPYFELVLLHARQPNQGWGAAAAFCAATIYKSYYDPTSGAIVDKSKTPASYVVSYAMQAAVTLLDAASRFDGLTVTGLSGTPSSLTISRSTFAAAGRSAVLYLMTAGARNTTAGLLARNMIWNYPSADTVPADSSTGDLNRSGEGAQDLDFMCRAYQIDPGIPGMLGYIKKYAESSLNTYGYYDTVNGGFFQSVDYDGGNLSTSYKEVGRQGHWIRALARLAAIEPAGADSKGVLWSTWRDRLINVACFRFFSTQPPTSGNGYPGGCVYRLQNNFNLWVDGDSGKAAGYVNEHWITSEACGIVAGALLDYVLGNHRYVAVATVDNGTGSTGSSTAADNGDGTATYANVADNGDGTYTASGSNVTDNGDGTYTMPDSAGAGAVAKSSGGSLALTLGRSAAGVVATTSVPSAYRDATNTGVPAGTTLTPYTGSNNITVAGTVIDGKDITTNIAVNAANVTIKNSRIRGAANYVLGSYSTGLLVQDCEIDGMNAAASSVGVGYAGFTLLRCNVHGSQDGINANGNVVIQDCYVHDLWETSDSHNDGIQIIQGSNINIQGSSIFNQLGEASAIMIGADQGAISNVTINNNLLGGGGYTVYGGDGGAYAVSGITITNNKFTTRFFTNSGAGGPTAYIKAGTTYSGNTWADGSRAGQTV